MENQKRKIYFLNSGDCAIYFLELLPEEMKNKKNIPKLSDYLKKTILEDIGIDTPLPQPFAYEKDGIAYIVCANKIMDMSQIASLLRKGEDAPFDEQMNNETILFKAEPKPNEINKSSQPNIVIHRNDIGTIGEMGNESMPSGFPWHNSKILPGSAMIS